MEEKPLSTGGLESQATATSVSITKVGGTCSMMVGVFYIIVGITHMQIPLEQRAAIGNVDGFYISLAQNPLFSLIEWWSLGLGALFALGAVMGISERVKHLDEGWVRWTSMLALLGFAVEAMIEFHSIARHPLVAAIYVNTNEVTRAAIAAEPLLFIDPQGWLRFGIVGVWVLVVSALILLRGSLPKLLGSIGMALSLMLWLLVAGFTLSQELLITIGALVGGVILAPIWFIWFGLILRREK